MTAPNSEAAAPETALIRYGELALKGGNRSYFERALVRNVIEACRRVSPVTCERRRGRILVFPERRVEEVARRLQDVFGIVSVSPAWGVEPRPEAIAERARAVLADALRDFPPERPVTFRVESSRADKSFPLTSMELDRFVADRILDDPRRITVRLDDPELSLGIDVREERAWLFARRLPGPGGLPLGTLGRVLCLLSGGIDSPVAAWMAMKRGARVSFVTFHSYPYIGEASKRKVVELVRTLTRWQPAGRLWVAPFTETQVAIRDSAPAGYRTVLYRRMMHRIACALAPRERATALVTGESLGQVASQTLENLTCIGDAAELPVLRPLLTFDKEETVRVARRIGTFETSIVPEPDCCTVFQPRRPVIRGTLDACRRAEEGLDVAGLVERAVEGAELIEAEG